jgi:uncharacterized protein (TIGR00369 family)
MARRPANVTPAKRTQPARVARAPKTVKAAKSRATVAPGGSARGPARRNTRDKALAAHGGRHLRQVMSGLELFQRVAAGELPPGPLVTLLGFHLTEAHAGRIVFTATPQEDYYNGVGVVHGGWSAALVDSAMGCAVNSVMPAGRVFATLELKVNLTRPLHRLVGEVRCEATVLHAGSRTATAEARVVDRHGKLYAHATTTCILVEPQR